MPVTANRKTHGMTIRVGRRTLSFTMIDDEGEVVYEPYVVKSGMSMAANMREAFKTQSFLSLLPEKVRVMIDTDVLMMPVDLFDERQKELLYTHAFPECAHDYIAYNVLPSLNAVALFSVNKDLKLVIDDRFGDAQFIMAVAPVWRHLHARSYTGNNQKLFGYIHENRLDVFSFQQNRFKFCNTYDVKHVRDAVYYLLFVWNQLQLNPLKDELHLVGDLLQNDQAVLQQDRDLLLGELKRFLQKVYVINPSADFNRAPITEIKNIPYDLQTLFVKGR